MFLSMEQRSPFVVVWAATALLAVPSVLLAQLADLPVKAGLWETHVSTKAGTRTTDAGADQVCFSTGTTLGEYLTATNRGASGTKCSAGTKAIAPRGLSYDTVCTGNDMASKGHIDVQLADAEHFSGSSQTTVTGTAHGKPLNMTIEKTFTARFLSPDCGNVKPLVVAPPNSK
jgi:hypothetical protein